MVFESTFCVPLLVLAVAFFLAILAIMKLRFGGLGGRNRIGDDECCPSSPQASEESEDAARETSVPEGIMNGGAIKSHTFVPCRLFYHLPPPLRPRRRVLRPVVCFVSGIDVPAINSIDRLILAFHV